MLLTVKDDLFDVLELLGIKLGFNKELDGNYDYLIIGFVVPFKLLLLAFKLNSSLSLATYSYYY